MAPNSVELAARKDIDLTGTGQVLPEGVPRTILVVRRTDEIVRADRPAPGRGVPRASPRGGFVASSATGAIVSATVASSDPYLLSVGACYGLTDARRADRFTTRPTRHARFRTSGAAWSPAGEYQLRTLLFAICRRHEIRSQCGVVRLFPHRNGIVAKSPFGIDVRHNDRAMEGVPVFL